MDTLTILLIIILIVLLLYNFSLRVELFESTTMPMNVTASTKLTEQPPPLIYSNNTHSEQPPPLIYSKTNNLQPEMDIKNDQSGQLISQNNNENIYNVSKINNNNVMAHGEFVLNMGDKMLYVFGVDIKNPVMKQI